MHEKIYFSAFHFYEQLKFHAHLSLAWGSFIKFRSDCNPEGLKLWSYGPFGMQQGPGGNQENLHKYSMIYDKNGSCGFKGYAWVDPEAGTEGPDHPVKLRSYRVPQQYWSGSCGKSQSYQANSQCWAIISPPAKRHLNGVSLVDWWLPDLIGIWIFLSSTLQKNIVRGAGIILGWARSILWKNY